MTQPRARSVVPFACVLAIECVSACAGRGPDTSDPASSEGEGEGDDGPVIDVLVDQRPHDATDAEVLLAADDSVRFGDPLHVVIRGLTPGADFDISSETAGGTARATFAASTGGVIDLALDTPISGTWSQPHVDGFLWSALDPPEDPTTVGLGVHVTVRAGDAVVAARTILRRGIDEGIVIEPVDTTATGGRLVGVWAFPVDASADAPLPAVLCFGGAEGGLQSGDFAAKYLATLGYAALGVAYFGEPGLPAGPFEIPLEILEEDLAALTADPRVDSTHVAVMGGSLGGMLGLILGARFPDVVSAVIVTVPSGVVWAQSNGVSPFAYADEPLPAFVADTATHYTTGDNGARHYDLSAGYLDALAVADAEALAVATTKSEDIAGPVFISAGDDDKLWPSCVLAAFAADRRAAAGVDDDDVFICHPAAGHLISGIPGVATADSVGEFFAAGFGYLSFGGTAEGNARALREKDTALRAFLERFATR